jgi:hypothetical protein
VALGPLDGRAVRRAEEPTWSASWRARTENLVIGPPERACFHTIPDGGHNGRVARLQSVERALLTLDGRSAARVRPALDWLRERSPADGPSVELLREYLWRQLPVHRPGDERAGHEVAWALGDLFEDADLAEQAALCRAAATHEVIAARRWAGSFPDVPAGFWRPAIGVLPRAGDVPGRVALSLASALALIETVGDGLTLTAAGQLPSRTVEALDDRFRWTEEFPWMHRAGEQGIPPVRWLREHLTAQQLLLREGGRLSLTGAGRAALADSTLLWRAVVDPAPRWSQDFERDALGLMAASLVASGVFSPDRMPEAITRPLAAKWRPVDARAVFEGAALVAHAWYRLGVPLGWWDTGRGPADRHPNVFGRAAAVAVVRSMGRTARRPTGPGAERPA